jgi:hypothetical protein
VLGTPGGSATGGVGAKGPSAADSNIGWNPFTWPYVRGPVLYFTGYYNSEDKRNELEVERKVTGAGHAFGAFDSPSAMTGESRRIAAAHAQSQIMQY